MNKTEFDKIVGLAQFLWENLDGIKKKVTKNEVVAFDAKAMPIWNEYFKSLILPGILPDGMSFGTPNNDTNMGVGKDGVALPSEYYQLMMQCYRYLYMALSSGEIYLKSGYWSSAEK